jgi:hypothetical protein
MEQAIAVLGATNPTEKPGEWNDGAKVTLQP